MVVGCAPGREFGVWNGIGYQCFLHDLLLHSCSLKCYRYVCMLQEQLLTDHRSSFLVATLSKGSRIDTVHGADDAQLFTLFALN